MPQFEVANFVPQMFWLAIFFAILYFVVVRPTVPKIGRVMTQRETQVSGDLESAERAKHEADAMQAAYDAGVADAHLRARARIAEAQASAAFALEARLKQSNAEVEARTASAENSIRDARARASGEIEEVAAEVAGDIVEKLTGSRPVPTTTREAARAALRA